MPGAIGWAPTIIPSRGGVIARPRFDPGTPIPRTCALRLGDRGSRRVEEATLLPVLPTRALRQGRSPCEIQVLSPCPIFWRYESRIGDSIGVSMVDARVANTIASTPEGRKIVIRKGHSY